MKKIYHFLITLVCLFLLFFSKAQTSKEIQDQNVDFCNLSSPQYAIAYPYGGLEISAEVYVSGVTNGIGQGAGIDAWIGISSSNSNPETWDASCWYPITYFADNGNRDVYTSYITDLNLPAGLYYYASRFKYDDGNFAYGGYNNGFWDGVQNTSGILSVVGGVIQNCNLDDPFISAIMPGQSLEVYASVNGIDITEGIGQGAGISAWIGYSTENTHPSTWTNWVEAQYFGDICWWDECYDDQYKADIGTYLTSNGTYYISARFKTTNEGFVYGGNPYGFWDGLNSKSGVVFVNDNPNTSQIQWCNLESPGQTYTYLNQSFYANSRIFLNGVTTQSEENPLIEAWIGVSSSNTHPETWDNWITADFSYFSGNLHEYSANIGDQFTQTGTYYIASKFRYNNGEIVYGGYNSGFWNGTSNINGVVIVEEEPAPTVDWCNLQYPGNITVSTQETIECTARVYGWNLTDDYGPAENLSVWIAYSLTNTHPSTWTNWVVADYFEDTFNGDEEYHTNLGPLPQGIYYVAARFQVNGGEFFYGGYSQDEYGEPEGGFWDENYYPSGVINVQAPSLTSIQWCNISGPNNEQINTSENIVFSSNVFVQGQTEPTGQALGISSWIGWSLNNIHPNQWTNWVPAYYDGDNMDNDVYSAQLGPLNAGTYYIASRFKRNNGNYFYGGYSESGGITQGGFWNGTIYNSVLLTVISENGILENPNYYRVFPNPFENKINISGNIENNTFIELMDMLGKIHFSKMINSPSIISLDDKLSSGIYVLKISTGENVYSIKLIKK